jgi:hypothetical protein
LIVIIPGVSQAPVAVAQLESLGIMKYPRIIFSLFALNLACVSIFATSCSYVTVHTAYHDIALDKFVAMEPFKATVEAMAIQDYGTNGVDKEVAIGLKKEDGTRVDLHQAPASKQLIGFAHSLKTGHAYTFPQTFLDYTKSNK